MTTEIKPGIKGICDLIVHEKDTARNIGSGLVEVFATPAMIALMERAAFTSVEEFLSEGFLTVGSEVNIKHIKATGIGVKVRAESVLTKVEGKKLTFDVIAFDESGQIGFGTHTRFIVEEKKFMSQV